jgi:hypothetical protein
VWHASIAVLDIAQRRTLTTAELDQTAFLSMIRTAKKLLSGVGRLPSSVEQHPVAIHYRRALTEDEYARLPAEWCAIPAVHEAGRGVVLEENT